MGKRLKENIERKAATASQEDFVICNAGI